MELSHSNRFPHTIRITEDIHWNQDNGKYRSYGIQATRKDGTLLDIPDISTNPEYVQRFIELCIRHNASEIHIDELLYDYLP